MIARSKNRRSTASAKKPAGKVKSRKGSAAVLDKSEMTKADAERWLSAQRAAVWSAETAVPLAKAAAHSRKKEPLARAEKLDEAWGFCIRDKIKAAWALTSLAGPWRRVQGAGLDSRLASLTGVLFPGSVCLCGRCQTAVPYRLTPAGEVIPF